MATDLHVEVIDAIIAGIGSNDNAADQAMAIIDNLERAGYVVAAQQNGVREGFTLIPNTALEWLFGEGPAADGKWFGEGEDEANPKARYWWRSKFRQFIAPEQGEKP